MEEPDKATALAGLTDDPMVLEQTARTAFGAGDFAGAAAAYGRLVPLLIERLPPGGAGRHVLSQVQRSWAQSLLANGATAAAREAAAAGCFTDETNPDAFGALAQARLHGGDRGGQIAALMQALALRPTDPLYHFNLGVAQLAAGQWQPGWQHYSWRWRAPQFKAAFAAMPRPVWGGAPPGRDEHLFIWAEQGIGDTLLYLSVLVSVPWLNQIALGVPAKLVPLLARSLPSNQVIAVPPYQLPAHATHHCPIGLAAPSLWPVLDRSRTSAAFLRPDPAAVAHWRAHWQRLGITHGIAWRSTSAETGPAKSANLGQLAALLRHGPERVLCLQYGDVGADLAALPADVCDKVHVEPGLDLFNDLDTLAAAMVSLEGVTTVSNTVAHLAGALGLKTTVLLRPGPHLHWYWLDQGQHAVWYPNVHLDRALLSHT